MSTLSDTTVRTIRTRYAQGDATQRALAEAYDCGLASINRLLTGKTYPDAGGPIHDPDSHIGQQTLSDQEVVEIRQRYQDGETTRELGDAFGVTNGHIWELVRGKTRETCGGPIANKVEDRRMFSPEVATQMRRRYAQEDILQKELAQEYDCALVTVWEILTGRTYQDAGGPIYVPEDPTLSKRNATIKQRYNEEDISQSELADEYGVTQARISDIVRT